MHFARAGITHHLNDLLAGRAANDGIVHQHHALALDHAAVGIVLQLHTHVTDGIGRLDEGAAHIMVADNPEFEGQARFLCKADGCRNARIGNRHHKVSVHRVFTRQLHANVLAHRIDIAAFDQRVRPGKIDIFKDAEARRLDLEGEAALYALVGDDHHFARLYIAHEARTNDVERAGFRRQDIGPVKIAEHERADAERITAADHLFGRQRDKGEGAFQLAHGIGKTRVETLFGAERDQVKERFGV